MTSIHQDETNPYASPAEVAPEEISAKLIAEIVSVPCPGCSGERADVVPYDPLKGRAGPRAIDHVQCRDCGTQFNGETGRPIHHRFLKTMLFPLIAIAAGLLFAIFIVLAETL